MTNPEPTKPYTLTTEAWFAIKPILIKLYRLRPPARLPVDFTLPEHTNRARNWLYLYFKEMNLKSLYRVRKESKTALSIQCLEVITPIFGGEDTYSPIETFVRDNLLDIDTEDEAIEIAKTSLEAGKLTDTSFLAIIEEWKRVMGKDTEVPLPNFPNLKDLFPEEKKS